MASVSEHIQNEFAKWQEQQQQHHEATNAISSMVWFGFFPSSNL
jgi:hypothetical protein